MTIEQKAQKLAEEKGWEWVESSRLRHPDDHYMLYTITIVNGKYATHLYNEDLNGFAYGHYDITSLETAREDVQERLK